MPFRIVHVEVQPNEIHIEKLLPSLPKMHGTSSISFPQPIARYWLKVL